MSFQLNPLPRSYQLLSGDDNNSNLTNTNTNNIYSSNNTTTNSNNANTNYKDSYSYSNQPTPKPSVYGGPRLQGYGKPGKKYSFDILDTIALLISLLCLGLAVATISPALSYAANLQYTKQIIVIGFLLGIMNQCLLRVIPQAFLLIEARFGFSTIQNYDGILRWSPFADRLSMLWRVPLILLLILPLGLGILYKRFNDGIGITDVTSIGGNYSIAAPPGLKNVGSLGLMVNATIPFMVASTDNVPLPTHDQYPKAYGYNIVLLSNSSAAALDFPVSTFISQLQSSLEPGTYYNLTAQVRGTVATYNSTVESHRNDDAFWKTYFGGPLTSTASGASFQHVGVQPWDGTDFAILNMNSASNNDAWSWNPSWAFMGTYRASDNATLLERHFRNNSLQFDVTRRQCNGTWRIARTSIQLMSGSCNSTDLPKQNQIFQNCQLFLTGTYVSLLASMLGPFGVARAGSQWKTPTYSVMTAAMYWSRVASDYGTITFQPAGWFQTLNSKSPSLNITGNYWNETYHFSDGKLKMAVPTLNPVRTLYLVLAIQPALIVIAFCTILFLYSVPMSRGFGMVSMLAGVDPASLGLLEGAAFSGNVREDIGLKIRVIPNTDDEIVGGSDRIVYTLGERGPEGRVKHRKIYA